MRSQRIAVVLVAGLAAATVVAQTSGTLRWRYGGSALGLQPASPGPALQCGPFSLTCASAAVVPLYTSSAAPRSVSMQVGAAEGGTALRAARPQGLSLAVVGKAGLFQDLGVYGRVGAMAARGGDAPPAQRADGGMTYGVGLSWDFSRSASAVLGFDSYDVRGLGDVRATRLGLQWRY